MPKLAQDSFKMRQVGHRKRQDAKTLIFLRFFEVSGRVPEATRESESPTTERARALGRGRGGDKSFSQGGMKFI